MTETLKAEGERMLKALKMQRHFLAVELKKLEQKFPKGPCLNAESHVFGSCFSCKRIEGYNEAVQDCITILNHV